GKEVGSVTAHENGANGLALTPDGKTMATSGRPKAMNVDGEAKLWDVTVADGKWSFTERAKITDVKGTILQVAFSPDGKTLATSGGKYGDFGEACLWEAATGKKVKALQDTKQWLGCLAFAPDGKTLVCGGGIAGANGELWLYDPTATPAAPPVVLEGHGSHVSCATFNNDGTLLVTGSGDKTIRVWDVVAGK